MLCCIPPLKLNIMDKVCLLILFLFVWGFFLGGGVLCYCPAHFPQPSASLCGSHHCAVACPCHLCKRTDSKPLISHLQVQHFPFYLPVSPGMHHERVLSSLLWVPVLSIMPEHRSREGFSLWSLSTSSLRSMNTCGLYYQILISIRMSLVNDDSWFQTLHSIKCFLPATAALCTLFSFCP